MQYYLKPAWKRADVESFQKRLIQNLAKSEKDGFCINHC
jgi:hypothetical protein